MTKADIVNEISDKTGVERAVVQTVVESFFKNMKDQMASGNNVYFRGFGSFILKKRARKVARNISKNTSMVIAEHYIPKFKPAKTFMEKVRNSDAVKKML
jgi:DNA-binding protein HU-beta